MMQIFYILLVCSLIFGCGTVIATDYKDRQSVDEKHQEETEYDTSMGLRVRIFKNKKTNEVNNEVNEVWERRINYISEHPELDEITKKEIRGGRILIGMTEEQVTASLGKPDEKNLSVGLWGKYEQWIYGKDIQYRKYLNFENGELKSWQE